MARYRRYTTIEELGDQLRARRSDKRAPLFLVPAHSCDRPLIAMLRGEAAMFERPDIWSWYDLYSELTSCRIRRQIDPPDDRLIIRHVLSEVIAEMRDDDVDIPPGALRDGFVDVLGSSMMELMLEGVSPERLEVGLSDVSSGKDMLLLRAYRSYLDYLQQQGLASHAQIPWIASETFSNDTAAELTKSRELFWVGFMSFTGAQMSLILKLHDISDRYGGMSFFVPDAGLAGFKDALVQLGEHLGRDGSITESDSREVRVISIVTQSQRMEMDTAARVCASLMGGVDPFSENGSSSQVRDIGLLVPTGMEGEAEAALRRAGVPYQSRCEVTVDKTPVIETALAVYRAYSGGWLTDDVMDLICRPVFGMEKVKDRIIEEALRSMPEGEGKWRSLFSADSAEGAAIDAFFDKAGGFCRAIDDPDGHTADELLQAVLDLSDEEWSAKIAMQASELHIDDPELREVDRALRELSRGRSEIADKISQLKELMPPLGLAGDARFSGSGAIAYIKDWSSIAEITLEPEQRGAVAIYDRPPTVLSSFPVWVMTGVDASRYPGAMAEDALVNSAARSIVNREYGEDAPPDVPRLHLPTLNDKRMQREALFRRMLCTGEVATVLIRADKDMEGRELGASPFMASIAASSEANKKSDTRPTERQSWNLITMFDSPVRPNSSPIHRKDARPTVRHKTETMIIPVSQIDTWVECPYRFWLERNGFEGIEAREYDMRSAVTKGNVSHDLWERAWQILESEKASAPDMSVRSAAEIAWDATVGAMSRRHPFLIDSRYAHKVSGFKRMLMELAEYQDGIERRARDSGRSRIETKVERQIDIGDLEIGGAIFRARADRMDVWNDGAVMVDYKLGDAANYKDSLQLACYAAMLEDRADIIGAVFLGMRGMNARGIWKDDAYKKIYGDGSKVPKGSTLNEIFDIAVMGARQVMRCIADNVSSGTWEARFNMDVCGGCWASVICRKDEYSEHGVAAPEKCGECPMRGRCYKETSIDEGGETDDDER